VTKRRIIVPLLLALVVLVATPLVAAAAPAEEIESVQKYGRAVAWNPPGTIP
jgi:hypothetical protein